MTISTHREALDCPCHPETRDALGGGQVMVHRAIPEGRQVEVTSAPDRLCRLCGQWHLVGHEHLASMEVMAARVATIAVHDDANDRTLAFLGGTP